MKRWKLATFSQEDVEYYKEKYNVSELVIQILLGRGYWDTEFENFLYQKEEMENPFILKGMEKSVERIQKAIEDGEKITVFGDYDADGITSTAVLYQYLESVGAHVDYYIPDRVKEGYGMNLIGVEVVANRGTTLIITVDNGITACKEVDFAHELGIDVIITDHHQPKEVVPNAFSIINPHQEGCPSKFKLYAGVGVVFKLICALEDNDWQCILEQFSDLIALGTVADIMPLLGENRVMVKEGVKGIQETENLGIRSLLEESNLLGVDITAQDVAFNLAPKINAAGRIGEVKNAIDLLLTDQEDVAAIGAQGLSRDNHSRKKYESEGLNLILSLIEEDKKQVNQRVIVLYHPELKEGIVGILASRIGEKFSRPTLILTKSEQGNLKGSGRTVGNFHLLNSLVATAQHLEGFGGHKMAAGLSLKEENLPQFISDINEYAKTAYPVLPIPDLTIDCRLRLKDIDLNQLKELRILEPCGAGNPTPKFLIENCEIINIKPLSSGLHTAVIVRQEGEERVVNFFRRETVNFPYTLGDRVDVVVQLQGNQYQGQEKVSVIGEDIRISGLNEDIIEEYALKVKLVLNETLTEEEVDRIYPTREEVGKIYKFIEKYGQNSKNYEKVYYTLGNGTIHYCKILLSIMVLLELGLIKGYKKEGEVYYQVSNTQGKVELESSKVLNCLQQHRRVR